MNPENKSWREALQLLKAGNERFVSEQLQHPNHSQARRLELQSAQNPYAVILGCADSRVVPELIFDSGIGDLFTIRVAGNIADASTIASIEYAMSVLGTNLVVVLGHQSCGAVAAALSGQDFGQNLNHLISHLRPAIDANPDAEIEDVIAANARMTAQAIQKHSPIVMEELQRDESAILPAVYHFDSGQVEFL